MSSFIPSSEWSQIEQSSTTDHYQMEETVHNKIIIFVTSDNVTITPPSYFRVYSEFVENKLKLPLDHNRVSLKYSSYVLHELIMFVEMYHNEPYLTIPVPLEKPLKNYIQPQYINFIENKNIDEICDILNLALYLSVDVLVEFMCATIASMMYDKNPTEIEHIFGLKTSVTENVVETITNEIIKKIPSNDHLH